MGGQSLVVAPERREDAPLRGMSVGEAGIDFQCALGRREPAFLDAGIFVQRNLAGGDQRPGFCIVGIDLDGTLRHPQHRFCARNGAEIAVVACHQQKLVHLGAAGAVLREAFRSSGSSSTLAR